MTIVVATARSGGRPIFPNAIELAEFAINTESPDASHRAILDVAIVKVPLICRHLTSL